MKDLIVEFLEDNFNPIDTSRDPEYRIFCPFCGGGASKDYSFDVNIEKGTARCWRSKCFWRGSFAKLLVDFLDVEYSEAYKIIEGKAPETVDELAALIKRLEDSVDNTGYSEQIELFKPVHTWPSGSVRVQDSDEIKRVRSWLKNVRGYDPDLFLEEHNLFIPSKLSKYRGRVLFQVTSEEHLAYIAYAMDRETIPKTLNPGGKVLSRMLYNYDDAKGKPAIFVCEGVFDAARLKSWGWGAVSLFGVALSLEQIGLLGRAKAKEIVICLDNGTEEIAFGMAREIARSLPDKSVSIMLLEGAGEDPDEIDEERFANYFMNRRRYIRPDINSLDESIKKLIDRHLRRE